MTQENLIGRTVAGYTLKQRIGEGGTANVYKAIHPEKGECAVKILKPRLRNDENARARFLRESEYGARVKHEYVVQTYGFGEDDELYYLALEWAEGMPLADFARRSGKLSPELTSTIVTQLAGALEAAHESRIIHRDLKPENIMFDPETKSVKLLDFGIARDAEADPAQRLTRTGFFVGTLQYVAPETLSGELVGPSADIYSLATITYYLLTQAHPFQGRSPRELFSQLLSADPVPLNQAVKGLKFSSALEDAVMQALQKDPDSRPKTVTDFADKFREAVEQGGSRGASGFLGTVRSFLKKN
ncbi:MAG: serine/threonine protein kinase [Gemmatimonadota bacterium]|nr:serine/threonine protein kinase [Gemmatimonadota bacterium]MDH5804163.1 serine/threonine protein kinase [Gemmatimonadota bacterium]